MNTNNFINSDEWEIHIEGMIIASQRFIDLYITQYNLPPHECTNESKPNDVQDNQ